MLIRKGHKEPESYGLEFFKIALEEVAKAEENLVKQIALSVRVAHFSEDNKFREFVSEPEEIKVEENDLICF